MVRTIVQLTEEQAAQLRTMAARDGVSVAALVRRGVDRVLAEDDRLARLERLRAIVGKYSGPSDLAERHDDYLAEAYAVIGQSQPDTD
jgi:hypothetical protein